MKRPLVFLSLLTLLMAFNTVRAQMPKGWEDPLPSGPMNDEYQLGPDSQRQDGVPQGKFFTFPLNDSKIFPGTRRNIHVYVPAQYTGEKPACVHVGLDGLGFHAPVVFDNLIHKGEMPVTIGIGLPSGTVPSPTDNDNHRFNRSWEFDGLSDSLCRFLIEEVFPEVEKRTEHGGPAIRLSKNPNDRSCAGASTGGIGAFTLAWERPDQFRRVFSAIGTFVCMRGGDRYPVMVRKTEPKPIRIFMQDGHHDQWLGGPEVGDWWIGNVALQRALEFAGYAVRHEWGTGPHSGRQADAIFPDAMRWLWKDWPEPIVARPEKSLNEFLKQLVDPQESWTLVEAKETEAVKKQLEKTGNRFELPDGSFYETDSNKGTITFQKQGGTKTVVAEGLIAPTGVALMPDGNWLAVVESRTHWGRSYRVRGDGTLEFGQRFYWFHVPDTNEDLGAGACCFDKDGRLYVATRLGVDVLDRNGRSRLILSVMEDDGYAEVKGVAFGKKDPSVLYIQTADKVYKRKLKVEGAPKEIFLSRLSGWGAG